MTKNDFAELQKERSIACVSVIVPTHRRAPDRRVDEMEVQKAVAKAKHLIDGKYATEITILLKQKLDELASSIDFLHNKEGIGLYVSPSTSKMVKFPFSVNEKVVAKGSFELRELLYLDNYNSDYYLLEIDEKSARLFKGRIDELQEIEDANFPQKHEELFEYARPTRGSSYVGHAFVKEFEKDKSEMEEIRMEEFLHSVDKLLGKYLLPDSSLLLSATEKDIALFKETSKHIKNIIGTIEGSASYIAAHELGSLAWLKMWAYADNQKFELLESYKEKVGEGLGVEGIEKVWQAAKAGRGLKLLVEKDYSIPAFIKDADNSLHFKRPRTKNTMIADIVEDIIETVLSKDGDVIVMENNFLANHERIALITRY